MEHKEIKIKGYGSRVVSLNTSNVNIENNTLNFSLSSEDPYLRYDWDLGEYWEVLGHNPSEVDMSRMTNQAAFLYEHDMTRQIGVIQDANLNDSKLLISVKFSKNQFPQEVFTDIIDGIRPKTSVGYIVNKAIIVGYDENNIPIVRVIDWQPYEGSSVSTPADDTVGFMRSLSKNTQEKSICVSLNISETDDLIDNDDMSESVSQTISQVVDTPLIGTEVQSVEGYSEVKTEEVVNTEENLEKTLDNENNLNNNIKKKEIIDIEVINNENTNIKSKGKNMDIQALYKTADNFGVDSKVVEQFLRSGKSEDEFNNFVGEHLKSQTKSHRSQGDQLGLTVNDSEIKNYDLFRAVKALASGKDCLEMEISREIAKKTGQHTDGFLLPMSFMKKAAAYNARQNGVRAYNTGSGDASGADSLVAEILDAGGFVDIFRHALVAAQWGVRTVSGLVGDYALPIKTSGMTNTWVGDSGASTEASAVFDKIVSRPTMLVSETQLFELAQKQMTPDAQMLAIDDMMKARAVELDRVILWGSGTGAEPLGVANTTGVAVVALGTNGAAITRDALIDLQGALGSVDANVDASKYIANYKTKAALMKLRSDPGAGIFVYNEFADKFLITNNIPSNLTKGTSTGNLSGMIYGNGSDVLVTEWGSPEMVIDNITQAKYGKLNVFMRQATNVMVRRPASFAVIKDIDTAATV